MDDATFPHILKDNCQLVAKKYSIKQCGSTYLENTKCWNFRLHVSNKVFLGVLGICPTYFFSPNYYIFLYIHIFKPPSIDYNLLFEINT
jgi:hypothetical protein